MSMVRRGLRLRLIAAAVSLAASGPGWTSASAQVSCGKEAAVETISGEEIRRAGIIRLADLFRLIPEWSTWSNDGFFHDAAPAAFSLPESNEWLLMIDDQPVALSVLGQSYLNAHPLDVGMIESIDVATDAVLCPGVYAPSGLIHIRTRRARHDVEVQGALGLVNETGDPGPHRYTELESPNVDRSGPVLSAYAAMAGEKWLARTTVKSDEHHVTDPRLQPRVRWFLMAAPPPRNQLSGFRLDSRTYHQPSRTSLSVDHITLDQFRFAPWAGMEVPGSLMATRAGAFGTVRVSPNVALYGTGAYAVIRLGAHPLVQHVALDWHERRARGEAGLTMQLPAGQAGVGFTAWSTQAENARPTEKTVSAGAWHAGLTLMPTDGLSVFTWLRAEREEGAFRSSALGGATWRAGAHHRLRLDLSRVQNSAYHTNNFYFWLGRGLNVPDTLGLESTAPFETASPVRYSTSLRWTWSPRKWLQTRLSGRGAVFRGYTIPVYSYRAIMGEDVMERALTFIETQADVGSDAGGTAARMSGSLHLQPFPSFTSELFYAYAYHRSGDHAFRVATAMLPDHSAHVNLSFEPVPRFSMNLRLRYFSSTYWWGFEALDQQTNSFYPAHLPARTQLDLAIRKRFWYDHLDASILLTNLVNEPVQQHPAGATEVLALHVRVQLTL